MPIPQAADQIAASEAASEIALAVQDWADGLGRWQLYGWAAWQGIHQRYAGSLIGPFWVSISMGTIVFAIGVLFGAILDLPRAVYVPYLAAGTIIWATMSGLVGDSCRLLQHKRHLLVSARLPLAALVMELILNHLIILAHNMVIQAVVVWVYDIPITPAGLLSAVAGLALLTINAFWIAMVLALVCGRFRDVAEVVAIGLQLGFYLTPIIWHADKLDDLRWVIDWNPLFHFIEVVRAPLLGGAATSLDWLVTGGAAIAGTLAALLLYARHRRRWIHWA